MIRAEPLLRLRMPAEWEAHSAVWLAWPFEEEHWTGGLEAVRAEFTALCRVIAGAERLEILVRDASAGREVEAALEGLDFRCHLSRYADIWLRDTGPVFCANPSGDSAAVAFRFNGWGGRYLFEDDIGVAARVAELAGCRVYRVALFCEGGALETDGCGTAISTASCLLNANRNPGAGPNGVFECLRNVLGIEKLLWLRRGLAGDHTDGHVDTLARFVAPGRVLCMRAAGTEDPNREVLEEIESDLRGMLDARGRELEVLTLPSPGAICGADGELLPASYLNFYVANDAVAVPAYGSVYDEDAAEMVGRCFPGRRAVSLPARELLSGGGAFHCITQQQPGLSNRKPDPVVDPGDALRGLGRRE